MPLQKAVNSLFSQLSEIIDQLSPSQYSQPSSALSGNTIGQHVRHIIELYQALDKGYKEGTINYELRKRDPVIETNKQAAVSLLKEMSLGSSRTNRSLMLSALYNDNEEPLTLSTNYFRELAFNIEHAIHHMALIRVGINDISGISLPETFGVAPSTIKYRQQCAQ